jgi:hypothetical protein
LRAGDPVVVRQFVAEYEPFIRRAVRPKLNRAALRRAADSSDLCQSALGSFLIQLTRGEFQISSRADLERLLMTFAQRKFTALARHEFAKRRDRRRMQQIPSDSFLVDVQASPEAVMSDHDLIEAVYRRLSPTDRQLFDLRRAGQEWDLIAKTLNHSPILLRKQLSRALNRIAATLGEEGQHGRRDSHNPDIASPG